jgi:hypothetical protein
MPNLEEFDVIEVINLIDWSFACLMYVECFFLVFLLLFALPS